MNLSRSTKTGLFVGGGVFASIMLVVAIMVAFPLYNVWQQGQKGKAALKRAGQERQILVLQATAERDAAVIRAEAITTIGAVAQKYPEYRYQEFLASFAQALESGNIEQIVYVPTEAQIPIMEAGRVVEGGR